MFCPEEDNREKQFKQGPSRVDLASHQTTITAPLEGHLGAGAKNLLRQFLNIIKS